MSLQDRDRCQANSDIASDILNAPWRLVDYIEFNSSNINNHAFSQHFTHDHHNSMVNFNNILLLLGFNASIMHYIKYTWERDVVYY